MLSMNADARLGLRIVAGHHHVHRAAMGQHVAEQGVERLHDMGARGRGLRITSITYSVAGRSLPAERPGTARRSRAGSIPSVMKLIPNSRYLCASARW
jgi:hypothetical protein